MNKQIITDVFLTKDAFEQHTLKLREETAKQYGMTLEQWDEAIAKGQVVQQPSGSGMFRGEF